MLSNHLIFFHSLLFLPSIFPSRVFSNQSALHIRWRNYWRFIFTKSPSSEYSELISFRVDPFDLLAVQGTFKSLLQHDSSKVLILQCSAFFMVLSHPYMTIGKTMALTRWTFVGKVMALIFSTLSSIVIAFLPRSKHLFISWLQSPFGVILELKKVKSTTVSAFPPSVRHAVMGPDAMVLGYQKMSFKSAFSLSFFTLIKFLFTFCHK